MSTKIKLTGFVLILASQLALNSQTSADIILNNSTDSALYVKLHLHGNEIGSGTIQPQSPLPINGDIDSLEVFKLTPSGDLDLTTSFVCKKQIFGTTLSIVEGPNNTLQCED